jgi:hypothetical protein
MVKKLTTIRYTRPADDFPRAWEGFKTEFRRKLPTSFFDAMDQLITEGYWRNALFSGVTDVFNNETAYATRCRYGWVRRKWFCDCEDLEEEDECEHSGWWQGYGKPRGHYDEEDGKWVLDGPRAMKRLVPLTRKQGIKRSTFGQFDPNVAEHRSAFIEFFSQHYQRQANSGLRMARPQWLNGGCTAEFALRDEDGYRYDQANRMAADWLTPFVKMCDGSLTKFSLPAGRSSRFVTPLTYDYFYWLEIVKKAIPSFGYRDQVRRFAAHRHALLAEIIKSTDLLRNTFDGPASEHNVATCRASEGSTWQFESLVRDWSMPHATLRTDADTRSVLYTRYDIFWLKESGLCNYIDPIGVFQRRCVRKQVIWTRAAFFGIHYVFGTA